MEMSYVMCTISYIMCLQTGPDSHGLWKPLFGSRLRVCALGESSIVYVKCSTPIFNSEITVLKKKTKKEMLTLLTNLKCILI